MSTTEDTNATRRGSGSNDLLGPLLAEADMDSLKAVAEQAGLKGIDLHALARVLDAAQRVAVAAERERCLADCDAVGDLGAALVAQRIRCRA